MLADSCMFACVKAQQEVLRTSGDTPLDLVKAAKEMRAYLRTYSDNGDESWPEVMPLLM